MSYTNAVWKSLALVAIFCGTTFADEKANSERRGPRLTGAECRMVEAVNKYRDKNGLPPLSVDPALMRVARDAAPYFSHTVNGQWCWHRAKRRGFSGWATDNIANGYPTPEDAVVGWSTSHGHAMQMRGFFKMNGQWRDYRFNRIGVGVSGRKYIAVFGRDNRHRVAKEVTEDTR